MLSYFNQFNMLYSIAYICNSILPFFFFMSLLFVFNSKNLIMNSFKFLNNMISNMFMTNMPNMKKSKNNLGYLSLINVLLVMILMINVYGLLPFTFSLTSHISLTMGLSLTVILLCMLNSIIIFKMDFFSTFTPLDCPIFLAPFLVIIESMSYIASIVSLGVSLAANISAGHLLMLMISNFGYMGLSSKFILFTFIFPMMLLMFIMILEIAVSIMQSYIFSLLTCIYLVESNQQH